MQLLEGIDIPDEVLEAHATGNLVFFVGAGASMSPPSSLPSFSELARQLGESARVPFTEPFRDKIDTFIGSLPSGPLGFDAHRHAAALLQPQGSKPNDVHRALVRLATSSPSARIVTTNFDDHLSTAALEEGVDVGDRWIGPALPVGRAFRGIVHLHGSLTRDHNELILDDRDFGRAYFGDGWAPRFLQPMFDQYVVLFIGYSLTDTVMRYLTLGLPSKTRRYALVSESESARDDWSRLDVTPIPYANADGRHTNLPLVLKEWDRWVRMRETEHREKMQQLVDLWQPESPGLEGGALPTFSPVDEDYLKSQISTESGARTFSSMASAVEWLEWADRLPAFNALFSASVELSEVSATLATWFADRFVAEPAKSGSAMESFMRHGQVMHPALRRQIVFGLRALEAKDAAAALRWRTILATSIRGPSAPQPLDDLLPFRGQGDPLHTSLARKALVPYLKLKPRYPFFGVHGDSWPRAEIKWPLDEHYMSEHVGAWISNQEASTGLNVLEAALSSAYELLAAYNGDNDSGPLEWGRSAIEPHSQDHFAAPIDVIIDGLRDLGTKAQGESERVHDRWWFLGYALFRRLALHLVAVSTLLSSDEKLQWVLSRGILFELRTKHEMFQVLRAAVPEASAEVREELLEVVLAGDPDEGEGGDWPRTREYEIYNLLIWLTQADPTWREAAEHLESAQSANVDFAPRDNPDFSMWHESGTWSDETEIPVDDFSSQVASDPAQALQLLESGAKNEHMGEDDLFRKDFALVRAMAEQSPTEGLALWQAAEATDLSEQRLHGIRTALVQGWTKADLGELGPGVIVRVSELASIEESLYPVAEFLLAHSRKLVGGPDTDFLKKARYLAVDIWERHRASFRPYSDSDPSMLALNTWPGDLVYFWLAQIQRRWREAEDSWNGLVEQERSAMESLLDGPPEALKAIWPAFASELNFIYAADPSFAEKRVLPLFFQQDSQRSAWGSFLFHPRCNLSLLNGGLFDAIVEAFGRIGGLHLERLEGQFESLAASAVNLAGVSASDRRRLLDAAVIGESGQHAVGLAVSVVRQLDDDDELAREVWAAWLRDHIAQRLEGVPRNASTEELARWADVVPFLGKSIPEAVELLQGRGVGLGERFFEPDFPEGVLQEHSTSLVAHYAERIRNTTSTDYMLAFQVRELLDKLRDALGDAAIQAVVDAAGEALA